CKVSRKGLEVRAIGQHRQGFRAQEVVVPHGEQAHEPRQVAVEWRGSKVLVHLLEAAEHGPEVFRSYGDHRRQADCRVHRVAPADPVPELEHVGGINSEFGYFGCVRRDGYKVPGNRFGIVTQAADQPCARGVGIGHRLERRKSLGRNDEHRLSRVQVADCFDQVSAVNVGDESKGYSALGVVLERLVCHDRAQVRSADPDIDYVTNAPAGVAAPLAAPNAIREIGHLVQDGMYFGNDVFTIDHYDRVSRGAQRDVEHGPIFSDVDLLPAEHSVDPGSETSLLSELNQQGERFAGDAVLGVIQENARGLGGHAFTAPRVI